MFDVLFSVFLISKDSFGCSFWICDPDFWIFWGGGGGGDDFWGVRNLGIIFHEIFVGILKHIFWRDFTRKNWGFSQHDF